MYAKSPFINTYLMRQTKSRELAIQNVADTDWLLKKVNDVIVVFNLPYSKQTEAGERVTLKEAEYGSPFPGNVFGIQEHTHTFTRGARV